MDPSGITPNTSNQQLMVNEDSDSATTLLREKQARSRESLRDVTLKEFMTVGILCFVNLINYMDRFTLAGLLTDISKDFGINDDGAGLIQTVFIIAYMVFAPIFGYCGDRYSRRFIMGFGVALWCFTTFVGSFIKNFYVFMLFRALVGIGEASYSTIAPTIISDLFVGNLRSMMLAVFYFAIPVGSGLGYIVGSFAASLAGDWRWGLRVTPFLGVVAVVMICWLLDDPERGQAEDCHIKPTSYKEDVISIMKNPSFMLSTLAFTCVAFVTGALAWWGPQYIYRGLQMQEGVDVSLETVSLVFGALTVLAGLAGVGAGSWLGAALLPYCGRAHPLLCGAGLLLSAPAMTLALLLVDTHLYAPFALVFVAECFLNLNWAIVSDMSLYVVIPPRRSTAEAFQILISHLFGDAGSPYLVGVLSTYLQKRLEPSTAAGTASKAVQFRSLQYSLFITCFVEILGGILFLLTSLYIVRDKQKVDRAIAEGEIQHAEPSHRTAQDTTETRD